MSIKLITSKDRQAFDSLAAHPLQSWAWGNFRQKLGQKVIRLGRFEGGSLKTAVQMTIPRIPYLPWGIGYLPRGPLPDKTMVKTIKQEARKYRCIFVKFEPNVETSKGRSLGTQGSSLLELGLRLGKPLFTPYTFQIDLTQSEDELLKAMKPKTRYNIRLAERKEVEVVEDNSDEAFEVFQRLTEETTRRQRFFAHNRRYRELMWRAMNEAGITRMLVARSRQEVLAVWILFLFNGVGYYPYGASSDKHRNLMANNLIAWRALQLAKKEGCKIFDFWGSLGPDPDKADPWYGFHRFKEGYGGELVEFVGTWDLVLNRPLYLAYQLADKVRWWWLRK